MGKEMGQTYAVISDADLPAGAMLTGSHDEGTEDHWHWSHWSILTIKEGIVVDVDWGYHSAEEALTIAQGRYYG